MEAGGDLVDELLHVLRAPVGAVMQCSASKRGEGEVRSAMETLCGSVAQLRGAYCSTLASVMQFPQHTTSTQRKRPPTRSSVRIAGSMSQCRRRIVHVVEMLA
eukprot:CAMPEP_0203917986 /NCGR_PEP_ID=MMETSP0359-20131031/58551_1 /ASSEMBLY_ACC=CAM_ASM_000338 /TAXON_ID=268821 /ORGANISM="Scrippsiella Hangoei, Strain SHTV-5" /LENGTH=102 /DNA_ID=CAMNT_0050844995 /DNA_START=115 /DNA_END=419 /DNA_ORIENTATION=-